MNWDHSSRGYTIYNLGSLGHHGRVQGFGFAACIEKPDRIALNMQTRQTVPKLQRNTSRLHAPPPGDPEVSSISSCFLSLGFHEPHQREG